jgi:putative ABC transport system ATP-binding protein
MTDVTLDLHRITKVFGEGHAQVRALNGVDLEVKKGEVVLIMGPSGSGKTTLLSIGGGILKPTGGKVLLKGKEISDIDEEKLTKIRLSEIGFIFQQFLLLASLTARENVQVVSEFAGNGNDSARKAEDVLKRLGLEARMNDIPANLSGGEKQRVAIARALINDPDIILADEPTANLDSKVGHEVMELLREVAKKKGKSVLIVSHDNRIRDIADRILWLEDGIFREIGKMTTDPVCGMSIEKGKYKFVHRNKEYFFCSAGCMGEFKQQPDKFIGK